MESDIPDYILETYPRACPREGCGSRDVRFRYFNNKSDPKVGYAQPRYYCNACRMLFTRGGTQYVKKKSHSNSKPEAIVRTAKRAPTGHPRMEERRGAAAARAAATARRAASLSAARRRPRRRPRQPVSPSSSSSEVDSEADGEFVPEQETGAEASSAAEEEAEEFEEEPVDSESNPEAQAGGEPDEATSPRAGIDIASEEETPAPNVDFGPRPGPAEVKAVVVERIENHLSAAGYVLGEMRTKMEALEAELALRRSEIRRTLANRKLAAVLEAGKSLRGFYVVAIRRVQAEDGEEDYEVSLEKSNHMREREDAATDAEEAFATLRFQVENTDVDRASHSDLVKIEGQALRLRERVYGLNEF